jgi:hypothetical protein
MLSMTPIEEAWNLNAPSNIKTSPYELLKSNQNMLQKAISTPNPNVVAYNNDMDYDEYVINVESFKPLRIDITIKDNELIQHLKSLSYEDQQKKATEILLNYYRGNPNAKIESGMVETLPSDFNIVEPMQKTDQIEYFESNKPNQTFLYVILALLLFMLYEKLGLVTQHT